MQPAVFVGQGPATQDADLQNVIDAWAALSAPIKRAVLALRRVWCACAFFVVAWFAKLGLGMKSAFLLRGFDLVEFGF